MEWIDAPTIEDGVLSFRGRTKSGASIALANFSAGRYVNTRSEVRCDGRVIADILDPLQSGYRWVNGSPHNEFVDSDGGLRRYTIVASKLIATYAAEHSEAFRFEADISEPLRRSEQGKRPKCSSMTVSLKGVVGSTYEVTIAEVPVECPAANCAKDE